MHHRDGTHRKRGNAYAQHVAMVTLHVVVHLLWAGACNNRRRQTMCPIHVKDGLVEALVFRNAQGRIGREVFIGNLTQAMQRMKTREIHPCWQCTNLDGLAAWMLKCPYGNERIGLAQLSCIIFRQLVFSTLKGLFWGCSTSKKQARAHPANSAQKKGGRLHDSLPYPRSFLRCALTPGASAASAGSRA